MSGPLLESSAKTVCGNPTDSATIAINHTFLFTPLLRGERRQEFATPRQTFPVGLILKVGRSDHSVPGPVRLLKTVPAEGQVVNIGDLLALVGVSVAKDICTKA
jgi:hypothetical protein